VQRLCQFSNAEQSAHFFGGKGRTTLEGHVKKIQDPLGDPAAGAAVSRKFFNGGEIFISFIVMLL
jgi:hypothetical protein